MFIFNSSYFFTDTTFEYDVLPYRRWAVVYDRVQPYLKTNAAFGDGRLDFAHQSYSDAFEKKYVNIAIKTRIFCSLLLDFNT